MTLFPNNRNPVIRDPVHGLIELDLWPELFQELMDTREFQRLRRIRQLGVSALTYPGAEHTRFAHSLGVFHVAGRILRRLRSRHAGDERLRQILDGEDATHVRVAALLHDLGHGPFSHVSERAFGCGKQHEEQSKRLILQPGSEVHDVLQNKLGPTGTHAVAQLLDAHRYPFLHDIVSGQLDADRMDYLLRDSLSAGVRYGHYDPEWVFNSFCLGLEPNPAGAASLENCRLCLDSNRGEHAATQLLIARMHMTYQVYFHKATRCWEAHLLCLFAEAARLAERDGLPSSTSPIIQEFFRTKGNLGFEDFIRLDDASLVAQFNIWADCTDSNLRELAIWSQALVFRKKRLQCMDLSSTVSNPGVLERLRLDLDNRIGPERSDWILDDTNFKPYKAPLESLKEAEPESYWETVSRHAILLANGEGDKPSRPIQSDSPLMKSLGYNSKPIYLLYYKNDMKPKIEEALAQITENSFFP